MMKSGHCTTQLEYAKYVKTPSPWMTPSPWIMGGLNLTKGGWGNVLHLLFGPSVELEGERDKK